jgi:leader peptidase (prepilin peptidase)/N-methyltransferase
LQKGRCRYCRERISVRYPITELMLGLSFVGIAYVSGININSLFFALLATELAILIVTDLEHYIIPDSIQVAIFITGIAYQIYNQAEAEGVIISMTLGLALGLALHYGYLYLRKKDALGWGDVKFLCVAGCWLPVIDFVPFLFLAGLIGTFTGIVWRINGRGILFPFGPALAFSLLINVLFPHMLQRMI